MRLEDRDRGALGYTTSLGFGKKLERIVADPHVALAFHAREHGFSASPAFVLAHAYRPQLIGLSTRIFTGWLEVGGDGAVYAPHTSKGFVVPPNKNTLLVLNGLLAKFGMWQARRHGTADQLEWLAAARAATGAGEGGQPPPG